MISFFHCTLFAALALLSFCMKASPDPHGPSTSSASSCSALLSAPSSWGSEKEVVTLENDTRNLTVFKNSSLSLLNENEELFFTFTTTSSDEEEVWLALILVFPPAAAYRSGSFLQLPLACKQFQGPLFSFCDTLRQIPPPPNCNCSPEPSDYDSSETKVSITYDAVMHVIYVQAVLYHDKSQFNTTFTFSSLPDADAQDPTAVSNIQSTTLLVGYITTSGEANITNVTYKNGVELGDKDDGKANSNHKKVVVWVIVGVSMMGFLIGLLILIFSIRKRRGRPSVISSRPVAGGHGAPPSAPSRAPFPYHDLEASPTPMMRGLPLSPPYKTEAFQNSGTASWLKQPNPR